MKRFYQVTGILSLTSQFVLDQVGTTGAKITGQCTEGLRCRNSIILHSFIITSLIIKSADCFSNTSSARLSEWAVPIN